MKHSTKKLLALALALVMVLSLAPLTANAEAKEQATGKSILQICSYVALLSVAGSMQRRRL